MHSLRSTLAILTILILAGCASVPTDRGAGSVAAVALERRGQAVDLTAVDVERPRLHDAALTKADAVRLALTHNPELRKRYAELGIAAADVIQAGRLANPKLSASIMASSASGTANQLTFGLVQNIADLLVLPSRREMAEGQFERTRLEVAGALLDLIARTERAWYRLVAAEQTARMRNLQEDVAGISSELAGRFQVAGNMSRLVLARKQAAASEARLARLHARKLVEDVRSELNRLMGLHPDEAGWSVDGGLALPMAEEDDLNELLVLAHEHRLELLSARSEVELLAEGRTLARRYRYLGAAEIGVEYERETDRSRLFGPFLTLSLPVFDQNQGAILRADALLEAGLARLESLEIETGNAVFREYQRLHAAREAVLECHDTLLPARRTIVDETQKRVNFMLDDVFDLFHVKSQEIQAYFGYIETVRDYWISRVELARLAGTELPSTRTSEEPRNIQLPAKMAPPNGHEHDSPEAEGKGHEHHPKPQLLPEEQHQHHHGGH